MKTIINLIILAGIFGAGFYFYQENKEELDQTLDSVKNVSMDSVKEAATGAIESMDKEELLKMVLDNKEAIAQVMKDNNIDVENIDIEQLQATLEENGISMDSINLEDSAIQEKIKEAIQSAK